MSDGSSSKGKNIFYDHLVETRNYLQERIHEKTGKEKLDGWIVCGSGLATLPDSTEIEIIDRIPIKEIPNWYEPQAKGHGKEVIIAMIKGQLVDIQIGRAHIYDTNNSPEHLKMITAPLIVAKGLGVNWIVTTNAAGVLENGMIEKGDVVVDADYVNQFGANPLMGPNDDRLGTRFPGKGDVADPEIYRRLEGLIPERNLHIGIYSLKDNAPFYEGGADVLTGIYRDLLDQNPWLVQAFGMSFAMEAMVMQHFNKHPVDINGFDRRVHWIGLTAATNIIKKPIAPTKAALREGKIEIANETNHEEVLEGATDAEKILIPNIIKLCESFTENPLSPIV
ncbi:MAG: hypothetical protein AAB603_01420 [Patescibacteria group bacterium]